MAQTTYRKLAQEIQTLYYRSIPSDDVAFSLRFIAEMCANDVAYQARKNAFENSNAGETTYSNDTFTSTFTNQAVLFDTTLKQQYTVLPQIPAALPNNQEITSITPLGIFGRRRQIVMMKNKDKFMQNMLEQIPDFILAYIENGNLYYDNIQEYMFTAVNITMIGAVSTTGSLLDGVLNVPRSVESDIINRVLAQLSQIKMPQDVLNDATDRP